MVVRTRTDRVRASRETCLELLLSDHAGSCLGPCTTACPAQMDVQAFLAAVEAGDDTRALRIARETLALPGVLGQVCVGHCESACLRADMDSAVPVRRLHGLLAERDLASPVPDRPACAPDTGHSVAVVGAGAAGLAAAVYLRRHGHRVALHEARATAGGLLRDGPPPRSDVGVLDAEVDAILDLGVTLHLGARIGTAAELDALSATHDAVVLAIGLGSGWPTPDRGPDPSLFQALGLAVGRRGLVQTDGGAQTNRPDVFACGEVVTGPSTPIRAMAAGRVAAEAVTHWLRRAHAAATFRFRSRLDDREVAVLRSDALAPGPADPDLTDPAVASAAAARCLGCSCAARDTCRLRVEAARLGVTGALYRGERRVLERDTSHPLVDFEPGKCILCGLCVAVAASERGSLGLGTFGRGFDTRIGAPFDLPFSHAVGASALRCAEVCPAGAITPKR